MFLSPYTLHAKDLIQLFFFQLNPINFIEQMRTVYNSSLLYCILQEHDTAVLLKA